MSGAQPSGPILGRRVACAWCGKPFRLQRLAQRFCSARCQKTGRRAELTAGAPLRSETAAEALRSRTLGQETGVVGFSPKNASSISVLQTTILESRPPSGAPPRNLLGGHRWPRGITLDPDLARAIVEMEIGFKPLQPTNSGGR
jgi:hypothetical protein